MSALRIGATLEKIFRIDSIIVAKSMNDSSRNNYVKILNLFKRQKGILSNNDMRVLDHI